MRRENKNMLNSPIGRRAVFFSSGNIGAVAGMFPIGVEYNIGKYVVGKRRVCLLKGQKKLDSKESRKIKSSTSSSPKAL